jgi:hypothetical protein
VGGDRLPGGDRGPAASRGFESSIERAIFATVLRRLFVPGSDRACDKWVEDHAISGTDGLAPHHLHRPD